MIGMSAVVMRNQVTTWGCSVTAWPGQSAATDDDMTMDAVADRVLGTLTRELSAPPTLVRPGVLCAI